MLSSRFAGLCIIPVLIAASPLATVSSLPNPLSTTLQQAIPSCAQSCLQSSLVEDFPVACTGPENLQCLCSHYSTNGESLGEVALGCAYSSCSKADRGTDAVYSVCLGQRDAVMPTKTALTVVSSSAARTTSTSSPATTPLTTTTSQTRVAPTQSIFVDSISSTSSVTALPSPTSTPAPVLAKEAPKMTPAQIAGLSATAVAAFVVAVGLMALSICLRRRKEKKTSFVSDEKGLGRKSDNNAPRSIHYLGVSSLPGPPTLLPIVPPPTARKCGKQVGWSFTTRATPTALYPTRPVLRNTTVANNKSEASLALSQIGMAISAELEGRKPAAKSGTKLEPTSQTRLQANQTHISVPYRPVSAITQNTVFEEDEIVGRRRSSVLLPPPIPPIRSLRPSSLVGTSNSIMRFPLPPARLGGRAQRSELSLEIPVSHERPQPKRVITAGMPSTGSPRQLPPSRTKRLVPPIRMEPSSSPGKIPASSNNGDIDEYYFSSHDDSPAVLARPRNSPKSSKHAQTKRSLSTMSGTSSRASTTFRDSFSSQTSFETADPNDPTPEEEDSDKQLSADESKLSPVAESPISNLRYPKVPRSSNQLVPRSPKLLQSPRSHHPGHGNAPSPRRAPSPSMLFQNRRKDLAPLLLETRLPLKLTAPKDMARQEPALKDPFRSPPRQHRHARSNSTESWSTTPHSKIDRKSRTQSGMWSSSPAMYDEVKPLNVRRKGMRDEMTEINVGRDVDIDEEGLKSPVWVPRLTPRRKGDDLFLSVGWGSGQS
jgi:hypothetical protein